MNYYPYFSEDFIYFIQNPACLDTVEWEPVPAGYRRMFLDKNTVYKTHNAKVLRDDNAQLVRILCNAELLVRTRGDLDSVKELK